MHESLSREVCLLLADGHKRAVDLVLRHKEAVLRVASELRDRETLTGKEVEGIVLLMGATVQ
jgi:ATP-dependent Zn protease